MSDSKQIISEKPCEIETTGIYEFRINLEKRIQEMKEMGTDHILVKIYEKTVENEWMLNEIYVVSRNNITKHQEEVSTEKANHQRSSTIKTAITSLSILCHCGDAFFAANGAPPLSSLLFKGGAKVTESLLGKLHDSKEFNVTILDHTQSRLNTLNQDYTGNISKTNATQYVEKLSQAIEAMHRAKTSIFQR